MSKIVSQEFILDVLGTVSDADDAPNLSWRTDGEFAPITFWINCSDVFIWGCSDAEDVTPENIAALKQAYKDSEANGAELFCARVRQMRPQGAWYSYCDRKEWPLFDACGPERETGFGNPCKPGAYERGSFSDAAIAKASESPADERDGRGSEAKLSA